MRTNRKIVALLCAGLLLLLTACGSKYHYYMDVEGNVSWDAVEGAVEYEAQLLDENSQEAGGFWPDADVTSAFVPAGYGFRIRPVFEDGSTGDWMEPMYVDANGEAVEPDGNGALVGKERVNADFTIYWEDLQTYEILSCVDRNTVETGADGSISFEAAAPNGGVIRFVGTGIELTDGGMVLQPGAELRALDAIGRISAVEICVEDSDDPGNWMWSSGGYTFTSATSVESADQLYYVPSQGISVSEGEETIRCAEYQPNFIAFGAENVNTGAVTISSATVYYDEATYNTGLRLAALDTVRYRAYLTGELYDPGRERFEIDEGIYDFVLALFPDVSDEDKPFEVDVLTEDVIHEYDTIYDVEDRLYTIGELRDAGGNVLNKETDGLPMGSTLDVTLGDYTMAVQLPVVERYAGAQTLHELIPYDYADAQGEVLSLVIPVVWQDQPENATEELLNTIYAKLGRVMEPDGTVTDHSGELTEQFSLSDYFDTASYGQYAITSFVTEWYAAPYDFEVMQNTPADDEQFREEVYAWLMATYPDMDWSRFDADGDGFFDSVIFINAGESTQESVQMSGFGYALFISTGYTGENAGTQDEPVFKNFVSLNGSFLDDNALIHEVSHSFGIIDYYDVNYSGVDAVGCYDMQSDGVGDWNAYSKYAVGWIEPEVISGLESGESVEITIGAFADTGDAVVIPAAGAEHDGPFGEYILLDLFTDGGVNRYDAAAYDLDGVVGVRVSHVDANMEMRVLTGEDGVEYPVGTTHRANSYNEEGLYQLEVIQADGINTFGDPAQERKHLAEEDLFMAGDVFNAADYAAFLVDGGMDDGSEFGYTVEIVRIGQDGDGAYSAQVRITRI